MFFDDLLLVEILLEEGLKLFMLLEKGQLCVLRHLNNDVNEFVVNFNCHSFLTGGKVNRVVNFSP